MLSVLLSCGSICQKTAFFGSCGHLCLILHWVKIPGEKQDKAGKISASPSVFILKFKNIQKTTKSPRPPAAAGAAGPFELPLRLWYNQLVPAEAAGRRKSGRHRLAAPSAGKGLNRTDARTACCSGHLAGDGGRGRKTEFQENHPDRFGHRRAFLHRRRMCADVFRRGLKRQRVRRGEADVRLPARHAALPEMREGIPASEELYLPGVRGRRRSD